MTERETRQRKGRVFMVDGNPVPERYFTKEQREEHKLVEMGCREYARFQGALVRFEEWTRAMIWNVFEAKERERLAARGEGAEADADKPAEARITIYDIPRTRRIIIRQRAKFQMSDLAVHAKAIIDKKLELMEEHLDDEMKDLFGLMKTMFVDRKRLCWTPAVSAFLNMRIRDKELLKAQDLLRRAFTCDRGRLYYVAEEKGLDGRWESVGGGYMSSMKKVKDMADGQL